MASSKQPAQNNNGDTVYRISVAGAVAMIATAIGFDIAELLVDWIPLLGQAISFLIDSVATISMAIWFAIKGISLSSGKAMARFWSLNIVEFLPIPVIDFGLVTLATILLIVSSWTEDGFGISLTKSKFIESPNIVRKTASKTGNVTRARRG